MAMNCMKTVSTLDPDADNIMYHPLLNDLVLENMYTFLQYNDLLSCRKVCKTWNLFSTPFVRQLVNLKVNGSLSLLQKLIFEMENCHEFTIPFSSFHFVDLPLSNEHVVHFFQTFGFHLKSLTLDTCVSSGSETFESFLEIFKWLPNLENLTLLCLPKEICRTTQIQPNESYESNLKFATIHHIRSLKKLELKIQCSSEFLAYLFQLAINLESLIVLEGALERVSSGDLLESLMLSGHCQTIRELKLQHLSQSNLEAITALHAKGMQLSSLQLGSLEGTISPSSIEHLLNICKDNLRKLSVSESWRSQLINAEVPFMRNLKQLKLGSTDMFAPIEFSTKLPHLHHLSLENCRCDQLNLTSLFYMNQSQPSRAMKPCVTLKNLRLPQYMRDLQLMEFLGHLFPNVKILQLSKPGNDTLTTLWTLWPYLIELSLTLTLANKGIDSVFTGISKENCEQLFCGHETSSHLKPEDICFGPSISDLRHLRKLCIKTLYGYGNLNENFVLITDITGFFALAKMTSLKDLAIEANDISPECRLALRKLLDLSTSKIDRPQRDWSYSSIIDYNTLCLYWEEEFS